MASGFAVDLLAPGRLGDVLTARCHRGVARPAARASTTSTVTNQRGERVAVFRGRSYTHEGQARGMTAPTLLAARRPAARTRSRRSMPVKHPRPGDLEPIETASRDELQRAAAAAPAVDAAARLRQRAALPQGRSTPRACTRRPASRWPTWRSSRSPTKKDLRDNYPFGMFAVPREQVVRIHASSGTTGKPTVVGYTQERHRHLGRPGGALDPRRRAGAPATSCTWPTATACSPAAWARTTAPSGWAAR